MLTLPYEHRAARYAGKQHGQPLHRIDHLVKLALRGNGFSDLQQRRGDPRLLLLCSIEAAILDGHRNLVCQDAEG